MTGESVVNNDDHLTFKTIDGTTYRIDITEVKPGEDD